MATKNAVVNAESEISGKQTRSSKQPAIKWLKLGGSSVPQFGIQCFLFGNSGSKESPKDDFQVGALAEINVLPEGTKYSWFVEGLGDEQRSHFTHFCLCVKPVE